MFRKKKKDLVTVNIRLDVELSRVNEFNNRYRAFAQAYAENGGVVTVQTARANAYWR